MRLVSFLGTGDYQPTAYYLPETGATCETRFVVAALARLFRPRQVTVLATNKAREQHRQALEHEFGQPEMPRLCWSSIREGRTEEELWENFNLMAQELREPSGEPVLLDITHGFRSQPFFAGAVVAFLRALDPSGPSVRVVYGAYDARSDNRTPIWDLTPFVDLLDWTRAIEIFLTSGRGDLLAQKAERKARQAGEEWAKSKQGEPPRLQPLAAALQRFTGDLATLRIGSLLLGQGKKPPSAQQLARAISEARQEVLRHMPPLKPALDRLSRWLEPLQLPLTDLSGEEGRQAMAALAKLYLALGRFADAGVVIREGWVNLYAEPEATRPGEGLDEAARRRAESCLSATTGPEKQLLALRNDLEHGGFRKQPLSAKDIQEQLENYCHLFETVPLPPREQPVGTVWFVSRHAGARQWAQQQGLPVDRFVEQLPLNELREGDRVLGTLPLHVAAEACRRGAEVWHLAVDLPPEARGRELSAEELQRFGARLVPVYVKVLDSS